MFGEIARKNHLNLIKIRWNLWKNNDFSWFFAEIRIKNKKQFDEFLLVFWIRSGAKVCESCRFWKMLKNEYLVAKNDWKSVSIQKRTSPLKFDHFRYPRPDFTASNLSTKASPTRSGPAGRTGAWTRSAPRASPWRVGRAPLRSSLDPFRFTGIFGRHFSFFEFVPRKQLCKPLQG